MADEFKTVINKERKRESLTPKQGAFVREFLNDPSNASAAAVRAGYSKLSARYIARRLLNNEAIKSILAQHFIDKEAEVSELLSMTLLQLRSMVDGSKIYTYVDQKGYERTAAIQPADQLKAMQTLLQYAKISKAVLGLQVDKKPEIPVEPDIVSEDELLARLESEKERILAHKAQRTKITKIEPGAEGVH